MLFGGDDKSVHKCQCTRAFEEEVEGGFWGVTCKTGVMGAVRRPCPLVSAFLFLESGNTMLVGFHGICKEVLVEFVVLLESFEDIIEVVLL